MKISIDKTEANSKLLRLMVHKDQTQAAKARDAFAAFITTPILNVIQSEPVIGNLYKPWTYDYGTPSSIPLAPLFDIKQADFIKVWAQSKPGGLATSMNYSVDELMVMTYALESAVAFPLNYIRAARVDVVAAYLQRMAQEFLVKQEVNSFAVLAAAVMQATFPLKGVQTVQVQRALTQGSVVPQDVNALNRLMTRINSSWVGGTPAGATRSITHLLGSPEFMEVVRNMAFEPLNTKAVSASFPLGGSEKFREDIYNSGGNPSIYGIELLTVNDMGLGFAYNIVASQYAGSTQYPGFGNVGTAVFSPGSEQLVIGVDRRQEFLAKLTESNPEDGSTLDVRADNQWSNRAETVGFWAKLREGRVALDARNCAGFIF